MAKKRKKSNPVLIILCCIAFIVYAIAAAFIGYQLIGKGIISKTLSVILISVLLLIALIALLLAVSRKSFPKIVSIIVLAAMSAALFGITGVLQNIDKTLNTITGDSSTITVPVSVIVRTDSGLTDMSALAGRNIGYSTDCTVAQYDTVKQQIEAGAAGVSFVQGGPSSSAINSLLEGSYDALIVPETFLTIIGDEIMPELNSSITRVEIINVTESYTGSAPEKMAFEEPSDPDEAPAGEVSAPAAAAPEAEAPAVTPEPAPVAAPAVTPEPEEVYNSMLVYISGNDNYGDINIDGRSDVNIVAAINFNTHKVFLVNIHRDTYLPISLSEKGTRDKITHCGIYGIQCSMDTIGAALGCEFDHFFKVNFTGFVNIIDALGGIEVYNEFAWGDDTYSYAQGEIHLDGRQALAFARNRYIVGIENRGKHHIAVIQGIVNKLINNPEILLDYAKLLESLAGSFVTDFSSEEIYEIVSSQLSNMRGWEFDSYSVQGENSATTKTYSMWGTEVSIYIPFQDSIDEASRLLNECLNGK